MFAVTLVNEAKGLEKTIQVQPDEYVLDVAESEGIPLPCSCRAGSCFDCLGKVISGTVEQSDKALSFLKEDEIKAGYVLLCASCASSDCQILTHQEEEYFA